MLFTQSLTHTLIRIQLRDTEVTLYCVNNTMLGVTDLVTVLTRWPLGSSRSGQTNRTLNSITTSRTLRTFFPLEAQI